MSHPKQKKTTNKEVVIEKLFLPENLFRMSKYHHLECSMNHTIIVTDPALTIPTHHAPVASNMLTMNENDEHNSGLFHKISR